METSIFLEISSFKYLSLNLIPEFLPEFVFENSKIRTFEEQKNHNFKIQYLLWYAK